jgi:hypothetical protein
LSFLRVRLPECPSEAPPTSPSTSPAAYPTEAPQPSKPKSGPIHTNGGGDDEGFYSQKIMIIMVPTFVVGVLLEGATT